MYGVTLFGLVAVTATLVCYPLEERSYLYILGFALSCSPGSASGFLQGAWRSARSRQSGRLVALRRWHRAKPVG
jgi:hypothetical protein